MDITSSGLCGSDLHLYDPLSPFMTAGDVVGHEPMGVVREVGSAVETLQVGDRVVVPFNISCGSCWMCDRKLFSQCETTQNRDTGTGASLFGYSKLYGQVPGGQAELLRVPFGDALPIKVPHGPPDDRFLFLSDVLPTAWQAVEYADVEEGGTLLVVGAGPIGDMATRIALHRGLASSPSTRCASAWRGCTHAARRPSTTARSTASATGCASSPTAVAPTPSSTPSAWRRTARPSPRRRRRRWACCRRKVQEKVMLNVGVDRLAAL